METRKRVVSLPVSRLDNITHKFQDSVHDQFDCFRNYEQRLLQREWLFLLFPGSHVGPRTLLVFGPDLFEFPLVEPNSHAPRTYIKPNCHVCSQPHRLSIVRTKDARGQ